jgi:transposase
VPSIVGKRQGNRTYYYLVESARVGGRPRIVSQRYLGPAEEILARLEGKEGAQPVRSRHLSFGDLAAVWSVLSRLGLAELCDQVVGARRSDAGASVGTLLSLMVANRVVAPCSKLAFSEWWQGTAGDRFVKVPTKALDHRRLWEAMDAIDEGAIERLSRLVCERLVTEFGLKADGLVLDMTNVSTYIDSGNERNEIARRGHAKNKRHDLRLVGLSLVVTREGAIPIAHHAYPGNRPDVTQFERAIETLSGHLEGLTTREELTVVFDAGMDSRQNFERLSALGLHHVASVPPHLHPELLSVGEGDYQVVEELPGLRGFETRISAYGRTHRCVVTHSEEFHLRQSRGFAQTLGKAMALLSDLARRLDGGKTRRPRRDVEAELREILSPRWVARVVRTELRGSSPADLSLDYSLDENALEALEAELFGKRILITDREGWSMPEVIVAYRSQWQVEHGFRQLKDPDHVAVAPMFHWTDQKIAVHLFTCVLALTVIRLMTREARQAGLELSPHQLLDALSGIGETVLLYPSNGGRPRARRLLTDRSDLQEQLFSLFGLAELAPLP